MRARHLGVVLLLIVASCTESKTGEGPATSGAGISTAPSPEGSTPTSASAGATSIPTTVPIVDPTSPATTAAPPVLVFDATLLAEVPAPAPLVGIDPASRAAELVAATADELDDVDPGWLAVYAELGIPVIDPAGVSTIADDPVGPHWDMVWAIGGLSRGSATIPLSDAATLLGWDETSPIDAATLLADLRAAASSADPRVQTFGLFVAGKAITNHGADLTDPTVTADQVAIDAATLQLVTWMVTRDAVQASITPDLAPGGAPRTPWGAGSPERVRRADAAAPCSEALGTADETSWINWLIGKAGGGVGVEGVVSTPGVVEAWITQVTKLTEGVEAAKKAGAKAAKFINKLNIAASLLSLIVQVNAIQVNPSMEPDPLIRRRENSDGHKATVRVELSFNSSKLDANDRALCALTFLSNALGVGLSFPADGATLNNVEMIVTSGQNFGTKVYFGEGADRKRRTNDQGFVLIEVQGKARPKTLPESAKEKDDEFGLNLASQVEELTAQSILNVFIDGLSLGAGAAGGAIDIAKTIHYDLGEYLFRFIDYATGYRVDQFWINGYRLTGEVCDLDQPFVIQADGSAAVAFVGPLTITPSPDGSLTYSLVGTFGGVLTGHGSGGGTMDQRADPVTLTLDGGSFIADFPRPIGPAPVGPGGQHFIDAASDPILLVADPTTCGGNE